MENSHCNPEAAEQFVAEQKHALRSARDTLTDLFPFRFGKTYPLPDVLVCAEREIVSYGKKGTIKIYFAQPDTDYEFRDAETDAVITGTVSRNGNELSFTTAELTHENYVFNVFAVKKVSGLGRQLLQTVQFKTGINTDLSVTLKDDHLPGIDYGNTATVIVHNAQGGCTYQAFDTNDHPLSEKTEKGDSNDVEIHTNPLFEDTEIQVKVANTEVIQAGTLNQHLFINVFPDNAIHPKVKDEVIDYGGSTTIILDKSQQTAYYQLAIVAVDDDSVTPESIQQGFTTGTPVPGTGTELALPVPAVKEDTTFKIIVTKKAAKQKNNLSKEVETTVLVKVRPDPEKTVSITEGAASENNTATIKVAGTQKGIRYQLRNDADNSHVGLPVFHHKNRGIGKAEIELDFVVNPFNDDSVYLPTGHLLQTTTFHVLATKATTKLEAVLANKTITNKITVEVPATT